VREVALRARAAPCSAPEPLRLAREPRRVALLDLFLTRTDTFRDPGGATRRATLGLMLDLISQPGGEPQLALEALLRGASYTGALLSGAPWTVAEAHQRALRGWGTYQRNELLSVSLQGLFAAVLRAIERDAQGRRRPRPGPSRRHDA